MKDNLVFYSQMDKIRKSRFGGDKSKECLYFKDTQNMARQYEIEHDIYSEPSERSVASINWYNRDLKESIYFGS